MARKLTSPPDAGLEQINDLERNIVLAKEQSWTMSGVSAEEIARERPAVVALAKAVTDRMRAEWVARSH
jgi:hypothetical protein